MAQGSSWLRVQISVGCHAGAFSLLLKAYVPGPMSLGFHLSPLHSPGRELRLEPLSQEFPVQLPSSLVKGKVGTADCQAALDRPEVRGEHSQEQPGQGASALVLVTFL